MGGPDLLKTIWNAAQDLKIILLSMLKPNTPSFKQTPVDSALHVALWALGMEVI